MNKIKAFLLSVVFAIAILLLSSLIIAYPQLSTVVSLIALVIVTYTLLTK